MRRLWQAAHYHQARPVEVGLEDSLLHVSRDMANSRSRKHLIRDLMPYTCIIPGCDAYRDGISTHFDGRLQWIDHIRTQHGQSDILLRSLGCPLCRETMEGQEHGFLTHISRHLEEISLAALPRAMVSDGSLHVSDQEHQSDTSSTVNKGKGPETPLARGPEGRPLGKRT